MKTTNPPFTTTITINRETLHRLYRNLQSNAILLLILLLSSVSIASFIIFYNNELGLAYNDARSHLDIGRRVVEGLKPGLAQLGSVWLPLPHLLMVPTIWNDFFWHSGLSGAIQSMVAFVATGILIYKFLKEIGVGLVGRFVGVFIFTANLNVLYLQSTAMTELLLLATMMAGVYQLLIWFKYNRLLNLIYAAFWIMVSTLVRYDAWFLLFFAAVLVGSFLLYRKGYRIAEGTIILFVTLAGFGIFLWFLWNALIFKDPLYFAFGPFSAYSQQNVLESAGNLISKGNLYFSTKIYSYALIYNSNLLVVFLGIIGFVAALFTSRLSQKLRFGLALLIAPLMFNILALYLGHSVVYIEGISGNTWFNVRYGVMLMPSLAILIGYLVDRFRPYRTLIIGLLVFTSIFSMMNLDAVTIDDAVIGASQKNVTEVSGYLSQNATKQPGFVLISAASHDAIIFSSGLPMKRFIHEGTGKYWADAINSPERWARWIVMRTNDDSDMTYRELKNNPSFWANYTLVNHYPFADIYQVNPEHLSSIHTSPVLTSNEL